MPELDVGKMLGDSRYLVLLRFGPAALRTLKQAPDRIKQIRQFADNVNIFCGFVATSGKYDLITIFQGNEDQAHQFWLYLRSRPQFEEVEMLRIAATSPQEHLRLIQPLMGISD
ncbi:MAG TPA: hypothetical protein VGM22_17615 [Methylomirabilota bacterium]|jgi:uncharacterized protein with GYD domain